MERQPARPPSRIIKIDTRRCAKLRPLFSFLSPSLHPSFLPSLLPSFRHTSRPRHFFLRPLERLSTPTTATAASTAAGHGSGAKAADAAAGDADKVWRNGKELLRRERERESNIPSHPIIHDTRVLRRRPLPGTTAAAPPPPTSAVTRPHHKTNAIIFVIIIIVVIIAIVIKSGPRSGLARTHAALFGVRGGAGMLCTM